MNIGRSTGEPLSQHQGVRRTWGERIVSELLQGKMGRKASTDLLKFCLHLGSFQMYSCVVSDRGHCLLGAYSLSRGVPWKQGEAEAVGKAAMGEYGSLVSEHL